MPMLAVLETQIYHRPSEAGDYDPWLLGDGVILLSEVVGIYHNQHPGAPGTYIDARTSAYSVVMPYAEVKAAWLAYLSARLIPTN